MKLSSVQERYFYVVYEMASRVVTKKRALHIAQKNFFESVVNGGKLASITYAAYIADYVTESEDAETNYNFCLEKWKSSDIEGLERIIDIYEVNSDNVFDLTTVKFIEDEVNSDE